MRDVLVIAAALAVIWSLLNSPENRPN